VDPVEFHSTSVEVEKRCGTSTANRSGWSATLSISAGMSICKTRAVAASDGDTQQRIKARRPLRRKNVRFIRNVPSLLFIVCFRAFAVHAPGEWFPDDHNGSDTPPPAGTVPQD
jgi:hypothetical protein